MDKSFIELNEAFYQWHLNGKGKPSKTCSGYSFDNQVIYHAGPCQRLIKNKYGNFVLLKKFLANGVPGWAKNQVTIVNVPDIGVYSTYSGDWLEEAESIHGRVKYIMLLRVQEHLENASKVTGKMLTENEYPARRMRDALQGYAKEWIEYSDAFDLKWGTLAAGYSQRLEDMIATKTRIWNDPKSVVKRTRQNARKQARAALGVD